MSFDDLIEVLGPHEVDLTIVLRHFETVGVIPLVNKVDVAKELALAERADSEGLETGIG